MTLSPEAQREAREAAATAPPLSPATKDRLRLILWGSAAVIPPPAEPTAKDADAA
jgi:hypothetical protein